MSYSRIDENREKAIEEYNEMRDYLKDKAQECDLYIYDNEQGIGCCAYDSDMPECKYADCKYLQDCLKGAQ